MAEILYRRWFDAGDAGGPEAGDEAHMQLCRTVDGCWLLAASNLVDAGLPGGIQSDHASLVWAEARLIWSDC